MYRCVSFAPYKKEKNKDNEWATDRITEENNSGEKQETGAAFRRWSRPAAVMLVGAAAS